MRLREFLVLEEVEEAEGNLDQEVTGLAYDSRRLRAGEIFFAIPGEKFDGHEFIPQALRTGAAGVVVAQGELAARNNLDTDKRSSTHHGIMGSVFLRTAEPTDETRGYHRDQWKDHCDLSGRIDTLGCRFGAGRDRHNRLSLPRPPHSIASHDAGIA